MSRRVGSAVLAVVSLLLVVAGAAGCGAAPIERPPEPTANPTSAGPAPSVPSDGQSLQTLGFANGPVQSLTVPKDASITAASDQPSLVTLVFAAPDAAGVYAYLIQTLPGAGFTITGRQADPSTPALSFAGRGWTGNFTGNGSTSALTLRPVA